MSSLRALSALAPLVGAAGPSPGAPGPLGGGTYHSHIMDHVCDARDGSMRWLILWVHLTAPRGAKIKGYFQVCLGGVVLG